MSFLRHEEIYRSDVRLGQTWERQPVSSLPVLIGCDEFPVGYSLAGCPPAEPASASPTGTILNNPHCRTMIFQRTATTPFTSCLTFLHWRSRGRRRWESRYNVQRKMRRRSAVGAGWESVHIQRSLRGMSRSEGNWGPRFCSTAPAQHPPLPRHQISPVGWPSGGDESRAEVHRGCGGVAELFQPRPAGRC